MIMVYRKKTKKKNIVKEKSNKLARVWSKFWNRLLTLVNMEHSYTKNIWI